MQSFLGHAGQTSLTLEEMKKELLKEVSPERITKDEGTVQPWENSLNYTMKRAKQLWIIQFHAASHQKFK